jgi:hypothetical protein
VIDTGVDPTHPALAAVLVQGYDFTRDTPGILSEFSDLDQSTVAILDQSTVAILDDENSPVVLNQSTVAILDRSTGRDFGCGQASGCFRTWNHGLRFDPPGGANGANHAAQSVSLRRLRESL